MQKHVRRLAPARPLPTDKPVQLSLPGIPEPVTESRNRLLNLLRSNNRICGWIKTHRYPLLVTAAILFLYLIGQGTIATGLLFATGLFAVNTLVDNQMGRGDE